MLWPARVHLYSVQLYTSLSNSSSTLQRLCPDEILSRKHRSIVFNRVLLNASDPQHDSVMTRSISSPVLDPLFYHLSTSLYLLTLYPQRDGG